MLCHSLPSCPCRGFAGRFFPENQSRPTAILLDDTVEEEVASSFRSGVGFPVAAVSCVLEIHSNAGHF